jgi:transposase
MLIFLLTKLELSDTSGGSIMSTKELFSTALGLEDPWFVKDIKFDSKKRRLEIILDFSRGSKFFCPECGSQNCPIHDTKERTWRHLDFFQHQAYLTARVPRVICKTCGVKQITVPWARKNTGFTLLFEIMVLNFAQFMAIEPLSVMVKVHMDSLLWSYRNKDEAELYLKKWYFWATHSRLDPIIEFAKTVKEHWTGILNYFHSRITNEIIEGINSKIKTAMKRAYGFKTFRYLRTIVYLVAGKLTLPTQY